MSQNIDAIGRQVEMFGKMIQATNQLNLLFTVDWATVKWAVNQGLDELILSQQDDDGDDDGALPYDDDAASIRE